MTHLITDCAVIPTFSHISNIHTHLQLKIHDGNRTIGNHSIKIVFSWTRMAQTRFGILGVPQHDTHGQVPYPSNHDRLKSEDEK